MVIGKCLAPPITTNEEDLHPKKDEDVYIVMMKGAPEVILAKCHKYSFSDEIHGITDKFRDSCQAAWEHFGCEGRRVIAFAHRYFIAKKDWKFSEKIENYPKDDLIFLGMAAMMDPPRKEAAEAICQCKDAGVKVFMITGDHPTVAMSIASQIGLIKNVKVSELSKTHI